MATSEASLTFVLSTGRCGTQWLAQALQRHYGESLEVAHEPLHDTYEPRHMLGVSTGVAATPPAAVQAHVQRLTGLKRPYLETGHPCWSSIPYLLGELGSRARVVHLARHPLPTCLSWLTHRAYEQPLLPHLQERILLSPFDAGVVFEEVRARWNEFTPLEKCLYYWSEVNAFALRVRPPSIPWLTLSYENLFWGDGLADLLAFLKLPLQPGIFDARQQMIDNYRYHNTSMQDWRIVECHPHLVNTAGELGYEVGEVDEAALYRRYVGGG